MDDRKENSPPAGGGASGAVAKLPAVPTQSRAPKPPTPIRHVSYRPPEPIDVPNSQPDGWPAGTWLRTLGLIREAVSGLSRARIAPACEAVVVKCKSVLLDEVAAARRKPEEAHDLMLELVKYLLIDNGRWGRWGEEGPGLQAELRRSKGWREFETELEKQEAHALVPRPHSGQRAGLRRPKKAKQVSALTGLIADLKRKRPGITSAELCEMLDGQNVPFPPKSKWRNHGVRSWRDARVKRETTRQVRSYISLVKV